MVTGLIFRPFPRETIPNWIARHIHMSGVSSSAIFIEYLTGRCDLGFSYDLPSRLELLVDKFRLEPHFTTHDLIDKHTLFPFYSRFMTQERKNVLRDRMKFKNDIGIHLMTGIISSNAAKPSYYRVCTACMGEDRQSYGEAYFHLEHQFPGITICPHHGSSLRETNVSLKWSRNAHNLITVEDTLCHLQVEQNNNFTEETNSVIWQLAQDAFWLLQNPNPSPDLNWINQRYLRLLQERDLASSKDWVRTKVLVQRFESFYSPELLTALGCSLNTTSSHNWLARMVRKSSFVQHPLYHLLFMQFLGISTEAFFLEGTEFIPFGKGLWPCLNKPCPFFRRKIIQEVNIQRNNNRHLVGVFSCPHCEFTYSRLRPDKSEGDIFRRDNIINFGSLWINVLKENWNNTEISLRQLAIKLGVHPWTAKLQAVRLGLVSDSVYTPSINIPDETKTLPHPLLHEKRRLWLLHIEENPGFGITKLRKLEPALYSWLYRHDRRWVQVESPKESGRKYVKARPIDWKARDVRIAISCIRAIVDLIDDSHRPIYLSKNRIRQASNHPSLLANYTNKLPISTNLIQRFIESRHDIATRKIWWAAKKWHQEQPGTLSRRNLVKSSGTSYAQKWDEVVHELNKALVWVNNPIVIEGVYPKPKHKESYFKTLIQTLSTIH